MVSAQKISSFIRKPYALDAEAEAELREAIEKYPYFNNAWILLTRSLNNQNSHKVEASLKQAGMYAGERELLYNLVNVIDKEKKEDQSTQPSVTPVATTITENKVSEPETQAIEKEPTPIVEQTTEVEIEQHTEQTEKVAVSEETTVPESKEELEETALSVENNIEKVEETIAETTERVEDEVKTTQEEVVENTTHEETIEEVEEKLQETVNSPETIAAIAEEELSNTSEEVETTDATEQDKVKSAYEKIFGSQEGSDEDSVAEEFETFDVNDRVDDKEPELPDFDENDFVLQIDDTDNADIMADATITNNEIIAAIPVANNQPAEEESKAELEEEDDFELSLDEIEEPIAETNTEESSESDTTENIVEDTATENSTDEIEPAEAETAETAIAFKLDTPKENELEETNTSTPNAETEAENEGSVEDEKPTEATLAPETSEVHQASSFFEWLTNLKNPEVESSEKKNEIAKEAITNEVSKSVQEPIYKDEAPKEAVTEKKSNVDDIIKRFIKINPTISRPKAEFYNPEIKSKESDTESDDLATETLAKIYRDQKLNDKAIDVYKRLSVIYPAKAAEYNAIIIEIENE